MNHAGRPVTPTPTLFWRQVNKTDTCWIWTGGHSPDGYGRFAVRTGYKTRQKLWLAHRWAYDHLVGPIPDGLQIDHLCCVRDCVNPAHLEPVTPRTNTLRSTNFAAINARKTHCIHGHEFTPENTIPTRGGGRHCRACRKVIVDKNNAKRTRKRDVTAQGEPYGRFHLGRCKSGRHDITQPGAVIEARNGHRRCRQCQHEARAAWEARQKAKGQTE